MKFLAILSSRYLNYSNTSRCRALIIRINRSKEVSAFSGCNINYVSHVRTVDVPPILPELCQWLECPQEKAEEIYSSFPQLKCFNVKSVAEYVTLFKKNGLTSPMVLDNPYLLLYPLTDLKIKLAYLRKIGLEEDIVPLLRLRTKQLGTVVTRWLLEAETFSEKHNFDNRLHFFADRLKCTCHQAAMLMEGRYLLLTMDFNRVVRIMTILLENGIPSEEIRNDLWIFLYDEGQIHERIEMARTVDLKPIKIWMLRCEGTKFKTKIDSWKNTKDVLGIHKDRISYLADRLRCSKEDVVALSKKYDKLQSINMPKVKAGLDFLFENGFTVEEIRAHPRVLEYRTATLSERLEELKRLRCQRISICYLFLPKKDYDRLIVKIKTQHKVI